MAIRLPTEFAINMNLEAMIILQQAELKYVNQFNVFNEDEVWQLIVQYPPNLNICRRGQKPL